MELSGRLFIKFLQMKSPTFFSNVFATSYILKVFRKGSFKTKIMIMDIEQIRVFSAFMLVKPNSRTRDCRKVHYSTVFRHLQCGCLGETTKDVNKPLKCLPKLHLHSKKVLVFIFWWYYTSSYSVYYSKSRSKKFVHWWKFSS